MHEQYVSLATRLIEKNGRKIDLLTMVNTGTAAYDPKPVENTFEATGVQTSFTRDEVDGNLVLASDKKYLFDSSREITPEMRIRDEGVNYSIILVDEIKPGETSIIYKVQARI